MISNVDKNVVNTVLPSIISTKLSDMKHSMTVVSVLKSGIAMKSYKLNFVLNNKIKNSESY